MTLRQRLRSSRLGMWTHNMLVATDQWLNALIGGDPDETISSRIGKRQDTCPICRFLCRILDAIDPGHCVRTVEHDEGKDAL